MHELIAGHCKKRRRWAVLQ